MFIHHFQKQTLQKSALPGAVVCVGQPAVGLEKQWHANKWLVTQDNRQGLVAQCAVPRSHSPFSEQAEKGRGSVRPYDKTHGKKVEMGGVKEGPSDPPAELRKDLPAISPLQGKSFWMPALPTSWKIKRGKIHQKETSSGGERQQEDSRWQT
ncbi:hypothetical protein LUU34_00975200 [Aix galericulata]|nr:hypothetical protein LUU34_00975200 [Aix galericulata]